MRIVIAGSSGFIGSQLLSHLRKEGHDVVPLERGSACWDPQKGILDARVLEGADVVINLCGDSVANFFWTAKKKEKIRQSRVVSTALLADAISGMQVPPRLFMSASAVGYYGNREEEELTENSPSGDGFLADVARSWEAAALRLHAPGTRLVLLRIGNVLGKGGGIVGKMAPLFRSGLGVVFGSGKAWMSWIAMEDFTRAISFLLEKEIDGAVNMVAPHPVRGLEFSKLLNKTCHKNRLLTIPRWLLSLLAGKMADELFLQSALVYPERLERAGFSFLHPHLTSSLLEKFL
jgi:uncharacterized protein